MISKVHKNNSFRETVRYILDRNQAEILDGTVANTKIDKLCIEFRMTRDLKPDIKKPVYNLMLTFSEENLSTQALTNAMLVELSIKHFSGLVLSADEPHLRKSENLSEYQDNLFEFTEDTLYDINFSLSDTQTLTICIHI